MICNFVVNDRYKEDEKLPLEVDAMVFNMEEQARMHLVSEILVLTFNQSLQ